MRERNLHKFTTGKAQVVVATDVAARGIHVDNVGLVVHFDAPNDPKAYLHRSGRTARAGESGTVVTITTPRQLDEIARLQSRAGVSVRHHDIRTTPRPMTAEALAVSGTEAPAVHRGGGARRPSGRTTGSRRRRAGPGRLPGPSQRRRLRLPSLRRPLRSPGRADPPRLTRTPRRRRAAPPRGGAALRALRAAAGQRVGPS